MEKIKDNNSLKIKLSHYKENTKIKTCRKINQSNYLIECVDTNSALNLIQKEDPTIDEGWIKVESYKEYKKRKHLKCM